MTLRYETNSQQEVTHTYTKCYASSVSLKQSITGPHSQQKKYSPHIPKLLLQNKFLYYPAINVYDFQKVSFLHDFILNFKRYVAPTIQHKAGNSEV